MAPRHQRLKNWIFLLVEPRGHHTTEEYDFRTTIDAIQINWKYLICPRGAIDHLTTNNPVELIAGWPYFDFRKQTHLAGLEMIKW